ncbi:MAG: hypothetical protein ACOVS5_15770, partial [Oligoflexus sp.]
MYRIFVTWTSTAYYPFLGRTIQTPGRQDCGSVWGPVHSVYTWTEALWNGSVAKHWLYIAGPNADNVGNFFNATTQSPRTTDFVYTGINIMFLPADGSLEPEPSPWPPSSPFPDLPSAGPLVAPPPVAPPEAPPAEPEAPPNPWPFPGIEPFTPEIPEPAPDWPFPGIE